MALSAKSVDIAHDLLAAIFNLRDSWITEYDPKFHGEFQESVIFGEGEKDDGGWECIFINIRDLSEEQLDSFHRKRGQIHNSHFVKKFENGITRLGWF